MGGALPSSAWYRPADEAWRDDAACINAPTYFFFPDSGNSPAAAAACLICHTCSVRPECLDYALTHNITHGIWGGTSEKQRRPKKRQALLAEMAQWRLAREEELTA